MKVNKAEILIIDDEPQIRRLLDITLQSNGYAVKEATSAKEGEIMAANHPPHLILLDLGLPDEIYRSLRLAVKPVSNISLAQQPLLSWRPCVSPYPIL